MGVLYCTLPFVVVVVVVAVVAVVVVVVVLDVGVFSQGLVSPREDAVLSWLLHDEVFKPPALAFGSVPWGLYVVVGTRWPLDIGRLESGGTARTLDSTTACRPIRINRAASRYKGVQNPFTLYRHVYRPPLDVDMLYDSTIEVHHLFSLGFSRETVLPYIGPH